MRLAEAGAAPGTLTVAARPRPGSYWFVTSSGRCAHVELAPGEVRHAIELGPSQLSVTSSEPTSAQLVPADADPFLRLMAARVRPRIAAGSPTLFHAPPGAYLLVGEAGAILREVELPAEGLALTLD